MCAWSMLGAYVAAFALLGQAEGQTAEVRGEIVKVDGKTITIGDVRGEAKKGDKLEVIVELPEEGVAVLATGRVVDIRGGAVTAELDRVTGRIAPKRAVRIFSTAADVRGGAVPGSEPKPVSPPPSKADPKPQPMPPDDKSPTPEPLKVLPTPVPQRPAADDADFDAVVKRFRATSDTPTRDEAIGKLTESIRLTREADDLSNHDDFKRAFFQLRKAIGVAPDYWRPYWRRGLVAYRLVNHGQLTERESLEYSRLALQDHQKALELYEKYHGRTNYRIQLDIAREFMNLSKYREAAELLDELLTKAEDKSYILALRGSLKSYQGDVAGALEEYNEAIRLNPDATDYYRFRAYILRRLGRGAEAAGDARRSQEMHEAEHYRHNH